MSCRIGFLNTAASHESAFNALLDGTDATASHVLRPDFLSRAMRDGLTEPLRRDVADELRALCDKADAVICSCSTLGPIVDALNDPRVLRIDRPMMERAAARPPVLLALCLESTREASASLLDEAFRARDAAPDYRVAVFADAWRHFEAGDHQSYGRAIAEGLAADIDANGQPGSIVLGQASMAAALPFLEEVNVLVLTGPPLAVEQAVAIAGKRDA